MSRVESIEQVLKPVKLSPLLFVIEKQENKSRKRVNFNFYEA